MKWSYSAMPGRLSALVVVPVVAAMAVAALAWTVQRGMDLAAINLAGSQRALALELGVWVGMVASGQEDVRTGLEQRMLRFDGTLDQLERSIAVGDRGVGNAVAALRSSWSELAPNLLTVLELPAAESRFQQAVREVQAQLQELRSRADALTTSFEVATQRRKANLRWLLMALVAINLVAVVALARHVRRSWIEPMRLIERTVQRVREGDLKARVPLPSLHQLRSLAWAFNRMVDDLEESTAALRRSESQYRGIFESARHGIMRVSGEERLLAVNPALVSMAGYDSPEEMMEIDPRRDLFTDPESARRLRTQLLEQGGDLDGHGVR